MSHHLETALPGLADRVPHLQLADLPTPVSTHGVTRNAHSLSISVKHDERSGSLYGGNKVRKLEYLLARAKEKDAPRVATYGAAGSNHALATALYARQAGFECTCLLSHQPPAPSIGQKLLAHQAAGTEIVRFGGTRPRRVAIQREYLRGRGLSLIPMGGTSWVGSLGFVNAGLELAAQIEDGAVGAPERLYVALGTMGTAAGLALGLALAGQSIDVHAVRVTDPRFGNEPGLRHLLRKTAMLMRRYDSRVPADLAARARVVFRDDFYGEGYGRRNAATDAAIAFAGDALGIRLDSTYSGKAMAALLADVDAGSTTAPMFWNTYNAVPLDIPAGMKPDFTVLPDEFERYFPARA